MSQTYEPTTSLRGRIDRRLTPFRARKLRTVPNSKAIVSLTFDDCPKSGIDNGVRPIEQQGWQSTIYVSCGLFEVENHLGKMMNADDAKALCKSGHEIGEHTFSHGDSNRMTISEVFADIEKNTAALDALGISAPTTLAYPYGETNAQLKSALEKSFKGSRGINRPKQYDRVDLNQIAALPLYETTIDQAVTAIDQIARNGGWLTLFTHDVRDNPSPYGCKAEDIERVIKAIQDGPIEVLTVDQAIDSLENAA